MARKKLFRAAVVSIALLAALVRFRGGSQAAIPESRDIQVQEALFNLPLGYNITPEVLDLFNQTARSTDFAWLYPDHHQLAPQIPHGRVMFWFDSSLEVYSLAPSLRALGEYFALGEDVSLLEAMSLERVANIYKKKTALAPGGESALAEDAKLTRELAPYADLFVIRAQGWLDSDPSPALDLFLANVHTVAQAARAANPEIQLHVELGLETEQNLFQLEQLTEALTLLVLEHPQDVQGCHINRMDRWFDPQEGNNLLAQTLFFFRQVSYAPTGAPETPKNFRVTSAGGGEVRLAWTDAAADELGFVIKRGPTSRQVPAQTTVVILQPDVDAHTDIVPSPGAYYYRIGAFNSQGLSPLSGLQAVDTLGGRPNLPPRFDEPPAAAIYSGIPVDLIVSAADPEGDPVRYSLSVHPAGMIIQPETGVISWLPSAMGRFPVSVTASDGRAADFLWFEVVVLPLGGSSDD